MISTPCRRGLPHSPPPNGNRQRCRYNTLTGCCADLRFKFHFTVNIMADSPDLIRRRLLVGVPLASASMALGATTAEAVVPPSVVADPLQPFFSTTDHVATYYKLARS